jgi:hypothetical protein
METLALGPRDMASAFAGSLATAGGASATRVKGEDSGPKGETAPDRHHFSLF